MKEAVTDKIEEARDEIARQELSKKSARGHEKATEQPRGNTTEHGKTTEKSQEKPAKRKSSFYDVPAYSSIERTIPGIGEVYQAKRRVVSLRELKRPLEEKEIHLTEMIRWQRGVAQLLELAIAGSLGFWVTVGMLAGWSVLKHQNPIATRSDGRPRCFWAKGHLLGYHDHRYGILPASDRELFEQLSLELLINNTYWEQQELLYRTFVDFVPEKVDQLNADEIKQAALNSTEGGERLALGTSEAIAMVIENAQRLLAFYREPSQANLDSSASTTLLRDWQARARQSIEQNNIEPLISHVRHFFRMRTTTPVGTFLQSVGLLPGAHFEGCFRHEDHYEHERRGTQ